MFGSGAVWGIDLGHAALKAVRMGRKGDALQVQAYEVIDLAKALPDAKSVREDRLRAAVQMLVNKHGLRSEKILLSIPAKSGVLSKFIGLPPVDPKRIPEMVKFEARQQIPFDLKEVIWDYQPVRKDFAAGESVEVGLFAARRDLVEGALSFFEFAKKRVVGVQISPLATYNFVRFDQKLKGAVAAIDMGAENTDLIIISDKGFWLRSLHVAGNSVNRVLMEKFNISLEEAETIKQRIAESKYRKQIMDVIQPIFRELATEIDRSLGYYKSLSKDIKIERLLLMGGAIRIAGLEKFLAENLHYPIQKVGEMQTLSLSPGLNKGAFLDALPGLGVALGLAVQGMRLGDVSINLLPQEFVFEQEVDQKKPWAIAATLCLAATLGLWFKDESSVNARIAPVLAKLDDPSTSILAQVEKEQKEYDVKDKAISQDRLNFLANAPNQQGVPRDLWMRLIQEISNVMPEGIYFREIHSEVGDPSDVERKLRFAGEGAEREGGPAAAEGGPGGAPGAPGAPPALGGEEAKVDTSKYRLNLVLSVETEYSKAHGLEFIRLKRMATLQAISLREDLKPLFQNVQMLDSREEYRNGQGEVVSRTASEESTTGTEKAEGFEAQMIKRLKAQRFRYLVVPIWCVVNNEDDYKKLPDPEAIDKTIAEIKGAEPEPLPNLSLLPGSKDDGVTNAVVQIKNNTNAPVMAYFSGKKLRVARIPANAIWHVVLDAGKYTVALRPEKEGAKGAYGESDYAAGNAYSMEYSGGAGGTP